MSISGLFADNLLVRLIRGDSSRSGLIVSMTGLTLGDRLMVVGLTEPGLLATLGAKVGITGRACGVDTSPEKVARAERHAEHAGVLVELQGGAYTSLPFENGGFDVIVVRAIDDLANEETLAAALRGSRQALRDGGRAVILATLPPTGLRRLWDKQAPSPAGDRLVQMLAAAGFRGSRILAQRDGVLFAEGMSRV